MDQPPLLPGPADPAPEPSTARHRGPNPKGAILLACGGVLVAALLGAFVRARFGALAIAATLAVAGVWRAVAPRATHAAGLAVRTKTVDVVLYLGMAVAITILALTVPSLG